MSFKLVLIFILVVSSCPPTQNYEQNNVYQSMSLVKRLNKLDDDHYKLIENNIEVKKRMKRFTFDAYKLFGTNIGHPFELNVTFGTKLSSGIRTVIQNILGSIEEVVNIRFTDGNKMSFQYSFLTASNSTPLDYYQLRKNASDPIATIEVNPELEKSNQSMAHNVLFKATLVGLGLAESSHVKAVMYPKIGSVMKNLSVDDITALQMLYGSNPSNPSAEFLGKHPKAFDFSSQTDLCLDSKLNSVLELSDRSLLLFKNQHYFTLNLFGESHTSPRKIIWDFVGVETPIDASLFWNGFVFLFKGNKYWKYKNKILIATNNISRGFQGLPEGPFDDVFRWNINRKIYFFKGSQFWKYDSKGGNVAKGYPKSISQSWKGIPDSIDAAFSSGHQNQTHFFKDDKYYRFDDINKRLANDTSPPYPRETVIWFLRCRNNANNTQWSKRSVPSPLPTTTTTTKPSSSHKPVTNEDYDTEYYENDAWIILLAIILAIMALFIIATLIYGAYKTFEGPQTQQIDDSQPRDQRAGLQAIEMQPTNVAETLEESDHSRPVSVSYKAGRDPNMVED